MNTQCTHEAQGHRRQHGQQHRHGHRHGVCGMGASPAMNGTMDTDARSCRPGQCGGRGNGARHGQEGRGAAHGSACRRQAEGRPEGQA